MGAETPTPEESVPAGSRMDSECPSQEVLVPPAGSNPSKKKDDECVRWHSFRVLYVISLLTAINYSICITSIWPYLTSLEPKATTALLGIVIGSYGLGQFISYPLFGWLSTRLDRTAPSLYIGIVFQLSGNLLWTFLHDLPYGHYYMILSRVLIGFGAGHLSSIRTFIMKTTVANDRNFVFSKISSFQALGHSAGPALQVMFVLMGYPGLVENPIHFNIYTCLGWFNAIMLTMNIIIVKLYFRECGAVGKIGREKSIKERSNESTEMVDEVDEVMLTEEHPGMNKMRDYMVVYVLLVVTFFGQFAFMMFETLVMPIATSTFGWRKGETIMIFGIIWSIIGMIGVIVILNISTLVKLMKERYVLLMGFIFMLLAMVAYMPIAGRWIPINKKDPPTPMNASVNSHTGVCIWKWCWILPNLTIYQAVLAPMLMAISFYLISNIGYNMYCKSLISLQRECWQGLFHATSIMARIIAPVYVGTTLIFCGSLLCIGSVVVLTMPTLILFSFLQHRIAPVGDQRKEKSLQA